MTQETLETSVYIDQKFDIAFEFLEHIPQWLLHLCDNLLGLGSGE
ncbi:hypothetical protein [Pedobacter sp. SYP-B3415]|nr:hypothetical protein [Pedobacter sp. SYP-B3415]